MSDQQNNELSASSVEIGEIILKIPGEHFFCESIHFEGKLEGEDELGEAQALTNYILGNLFASSFSPYPEEQLSWGYFASFEDRKALIFACPLTKLRKLGWQNLEVFRRVFPSFVSFFGKSYLKPSVLLLLDADTLSVGSFEKGSKIPDQVYSLPIDSEDPESIEVARGKLLSLVDIDSHEVIPDILVSGEIERQKDGYFKFDHEWREGTNPSLEIDQAVTISGDELWTADLRSIDFKSGEKDRRRLGRKRWKATLAWTLSMAAMLVLFLSLKIMGVKLEDKQALANEMAAEVPLVIESQKLLEKLRQNKLGGIDPFGAIGRLYAHLGGTDGNLNVWFTFAHFKSRNEIELEGEGKNVEAINTFLENLEKNKVASLRLGRSGKELREIKSQTGKTTFEFEIELKEKIDDVSTDEQSRKAADISG